MSTQIKSPGTELNRLMDAMGLPDQLGDLYGAALDRAINNDLGVARNFLDAFSGLTTNELDRAFERNGFAEAGHCPKPRDVLKDSMDQKKNTYYERETIQQYKLVGTGNALFRIDGKTVDIGQSMTPAMFEAKLKLSPEFRKKIEDQLGARIVLDDKSDGKITIAKPRLGSPSTYQTPQKALAEFPKKHSWLKDSIEPRDHRTSSNTDVVRDHRTMSNSANSNVVRDHRTSLNHEVRDHRTTNTQTGVADFIRNDPGQPSIGEFISNQIGPSSQLPANSRPDSLVASLYRALMQMEKLQRTESPQPQGTADATPAQGTPSSAPAQGTQNSQETGGSDLSAILNDRSMPFEQKIALFLFAFMEKKQKEIEKKTAALDQQKKANEANQANGANQGGNSVFRTIGTIGGAVAGGYFGGPTGIGMGANIGGQIGGALDGAGQSGGAGNTGGTGAAGGTGNGEDSHQVAMKKLQQEIEDMNKMFTLIDNMLKSMNDVVRQGPLAAIRG